MDLHTIFNHKEIQDCDWLVWSGTTFVIKERIPRKKEDNRETLARFFLACVRQIKTLRSVAYEPASKMVRSLWIEEVDPKRPKTLPRIIGEDGFLRLYALGSPINVALFRRIWRRLGEPLEDKTIELEPFYVEWNDPRFKFYDINPTPPGLLPKMSAYFRLKKDRDLLKLVASDLATVSQYDSAIKRKVLTLALLSHGAAYREIDNQTLWIASFQVKNQLHAYQCRQHLIGEGVKTISLIPHVEGAPSLYICQGTELWPSQPSVLGSILANFAEHGSATQVYAHSWRLIHKHLRNLPGKPIVAGHSMGGALAIQIGLYSHSLIEGVYAFNPPMPNERDYHFYQQLSDSSKQHIQVITNLDDFAFWRIGARVIGNVTLFLGKKRWNYYSVSLWDCLFFLPACIKFFRNVHHAFPAHQNIAHLYENWVAVKLTSSEIEKENVERVTRFDYLRFFPKLYDPMKVLLTRIRAIFKWQLEKNYIRNEIEILTLHEKDLLDTMTEENKPEILKEIKSLRHQKGTLIRKLLKFSS